MQSKLKLNLEQLRVDSFEPEAAEGEGRGTVVGQDSWIETRYDYTCRGYGTCGIYPCKAVP